jgi:hypothetical protein
MIAKPIYAYNGVPDFNIVDALPGLLRNCLSCERFHTPSACLHINIMPMKKQDRRESKAV